MSQYRDTLERQVRHLQLGLSAMALVVAVMTVAAFRPQTPDVIRARGIVIEDASGRARILIGSPVPTVSSRLRTDTARVRSAWARRFPPQYMNWYRTYQHATNGIILLDSAGVDRLVLGDPVPDPNIGRRIAPSTGLVINDGAGFERTGYGILTLAGKNRVVLGLDRPGGEAVGLMVDDPAGAGLFANDGARNAWLGTSAPAAADAGAKPFFGLTIGNGSAIKLRLGADSAR